MTLLGSGGFDARQHEPLRCFEPVPPGHYLAAIVASEMKETIAGDGEYLELAFKILEGEHEGRTLWRRLQLQHPNPRAEEYSRAELSAICRATRVLTPRDSLELHDIPIRVEVRRRRRRDTGEITSEIRGYGPRGTPLAEAAVDVPEDSNPTQRALWDD